MTALIPIDEVASLLGSRARELAAELLPHGRRDGHEWRVGSLAGEAGQSLAVHLSGAKAGVWADFSSGERGDALDLVAAVLFAGDKRQALTWARRWLGLEDGDPAALETRRREARAREAQADAEAEATRHSAHRLWLNCQDRIADTPVERYLAGRGIDLAALGRQPRAIRFHPALRHRMAERAMPAMVTAVCAADGRFLAAHRTWLEQAGPNDWRKARVENPKMTLGAYAGGSIRLWRGASGRPLREAPDGETVDVTEGIEDGLSVASACPECRVVAAVSLSNMAALEFPPQVRAVRLWRQNDEHPAAVAAFDRAVRAHLERGLDVLLPPIDGVKDVNDLLRASA